MILLLGILNRGISAAGLLLHANYFIHYNNEGNQ